MMNDRIIITFNEGNVAEIQVNDSIRIVKINEDAGTSLLLNAETGVLSLLDKKGNVLSQVDFPTEKIIKNAYYDYTSQELVLEFENAPVVRIPIKTDLDDYYTKEETNELLENKSNKEDVYTKEEIDTKLDEFDSTNYAVLVGQEDGELFKMNADGTLNKEEPLSEEVETLYDVATSSNLDVTSDTQIPTSKAVQSMIDNALGDIESLLEAI